MSDFAKDTNVPINDCINRRDAIEAVGFYSLHSGDKLLFADKALRDLPSAQRWIPVTERLPEYGDKVLVTFRNKYIDRTTIGVSRCYVQKEGFFSDRPFDYVAVAWMPLPEPWEGEESDG